MENTAIFEYLYIGGNDMYEQYTIWLDKDAAKSRIRSLEEMFPERDFVIFTREDV